MKKEKCAQCEDPNLKGLHTCKKKRLLRNRKRDREWELWRELQEDHGYTLTEVRGKKDRVGMMLERATGNIVPYVVMRIMFPANSALGEAVTKNRKGEKK